MFRADPVLDLSSDHFEVGLVRERTVAFSLLPSYEWRAGLSVGSKNISTPPDGRRVCQVQLFMLQKCSRSKPTETIFHHRVAKAVTQVV